MREVVRDGWKELRQRGDDDEDAPLSSQPSKAGAAAAGSQLAVAASAEEKDWYDTGYTVREIGPSLIRIWLALQAVGLFFQFLLWQEVSGHLAEYEEDVLRECAPERKQHGVCMGPMWNMSVWQDVVIVKTGSAAGGAGNQSFDFSTRSSPPTFLISVDPVSRGTGDGEPPSLLSMSGDDREAVVRDARWEMEVTRINPPQGGPPLKKFHSGQGSLTFEDLSVEVKESMASRGRVDWRATMSSRGVNSQKIRYVVFVEDAASSATSASSLAAVRASPQCVFGLSWKGFNEQHQGQHHRALSRCRFLLGIFLFVGAALVYLVYTEVDKSRGKSHQYRFHYVVLAKFVFQDFVQQVCIVLYIFGWFEASGLRCQLCLFHQEYCEASHPFHFANSVAIACTLASSMANQLLVRPVFRKTYTEDDICLQYWIRIAGLTISSLPFTTGICWASRSLIPMPTLFHIIFAVPCGIGWMSLLCAFCFPLIVCCDEGSLCDDDYL